MTVPSLTDAFATIESLLARAERAERERDELREALAGFVRDWNAGRPLDTSVYMARALLDRLAVRS